MGYGIYLATVMSQRFFLMPVGGILAVLTLGYLWMVTLSFYLQLKEELKQATYQARRSRYPGPIYEVN